jgi:hypothetical protein
LGQPQVTKLIVTHVRVECFLEHQVACDLRGDLEPWLGGTRIFVDVKDPFGVFLVEADQIVERPVVRA